MNRFFLLFAILPFVLFAQWSSDPRNPDEISYGYNVVACSDEKDGLFVFSSYTSISYEYIIGQYLDSTGQKQWGTNGINVVRGDHQRTPYDCVADGEGGVYVVWEDQRRRVPHQWDSTDVYIQRIDRNGNKLWDSTGELLSTGQADAMAPRIVRLKDSTIVISWEDNRDLPNVSPSIYLQKMNKNGDKLWDENGVYLLEPIYNTGYGDIVSHKNTVYFSGGNGTLYKITSDSTIDTLTTSFTSLDLLVMNEKLNFCNYTYKYNPYPNFALYIKGVDSLGNKLWGQNGIQISDSIGTGTYRVEIINDGLNGYIVSWDEEIEDTKKMYLQRFNESGSALWNQDSVQGGKYLVHDGLNGFYSFKSYANQDTSYYYVRHLDLNGEPNWSQDSVLYDASPYLQSPSWYHSRNILNNDNSIYIIWWEDQMTPNRGVFCRKINPDGTLGGVTSVPEIEYPQIPATFEIVSVYPNPFNSSTNFRITLPKPALIDVEIFNINGKKIMEEKIDLPAGQHNYSYSMKPGLSTGLYFFRFSAYKTRQTQKVLYLK